MKTNLFNLVILLFSSITSNSQIKYLPNRPYVEWQVPHPAVDYKYIFHESSFESDSSDGYNCFEGFAKLSLLDGKFLYLTFMAQSNFEAAGYFVVKFDTEFGKEVWRKEISLKTIDKREYPVAMIFDENKNIRVISYQKRAEFTDLPSLFFSLNDKSGMTSRLFAESDGTLLDVNLSIESIYSDGSYSTGAFYSVTIPVKNFLLHIQNEFSTDDKYTIFRTINPSDLSITKVDTFLQKGQLRYGFTGFYADDYDFNNGLYADKLDFGNKVSLAKFDLSGNVIKEVIADSTIEFAYGLNISSVTNDYIAMEGLVINDTTEFGIQYMYFFNHNMVLLKKVVNPFYNLNENISFVKNYNGKKILFNTIYKTFEFDKSFGYYNLYLYDLMNDSVQTLIHLPYSDSLMQALPHNVLISGNKVILLMYENAYFFNKNNNGYELDGNAKAYSLIQIDLNKLVSTKEQNYINNIEMYPNPAFDYITLKANNKIKEYFISDVTGHIIMSSNMASEKIDLSHIPKGIYFLVATDFSGSKSSTKFTKM